MTDIFVMRGDCLMTPDPAIHQAQHWRLGKWSSEHYDSKSYESTGAQPSWPGVTEEALWDVCKRLDPDWHHWGDSFPDDPILISMCASQWPDTARNIEQPLHTCTALVSPIKRLRVTLYGSGCSNCKDYPGCSDENMIYTLQILQPPPTATADYWRIYSAEMDWCTPG